MNSVTMKCEETIDKGPTRIRGWHDTASCKYKAKYKVTYRDGSVKHLCGVHANRDKVLGYVVKMEKL